MTWPTPQEQAKRERQKTDEIAEAEARRLDQLRAYVRTQQEAEATRYRGKPA